MPINLATTLANSNPAAVPYLVKDTDLRGGFKVVADTVARDALHVGSRTIGQLVYSVADTTFYTLAGGIANTNWAAANLAGAVALGAGLKLDGTGAIVIDETTMPALATSDITGLDTALAGKSDTTHNHTIESLSDSTITALADGETLISAAGVWINQTLAEAGISATGHVHTTAEVTGLDTALSGKADTSHVHTTAEVTGLDTALAGMADAAHVHTTAEVTGLDTALAGKSDTSHNHTLESLSDTTFSLIADGETLIYQAGVWINRTLAEAGVAPATHAHTTADITGLDTALAGLASSTHVHDAADVTTGVFDVARLPQVSTQPGVTISASAPTGGIDGDIWFQVV